MYDDEGRFLDKAGHNSSQMRYSEDLYRQYAVEFIRANKEQPFFLYYATPLVHGPLAVKSLGRFKDNRDWSYPQKLWAAMVEQLDQSVGTLLDEVHKLGLEKNTLILFASDNGYSQGGYFQRQKWEDDPLFHNKGPWKLGKFVVTNGGVIVPFIVWGPGRVPAGTKTDRAVNFYDFMATAGELSGAKLPGPTDGVSFVPLLEGRDRDQPLRSVMHWPYTKGNLRLKDDWGTAGSKEEFRDPNAVLLDEKWYAIQLGKTIRLFNIMTDPGMKHDLSAQMPELHTRARAEFRNMVNTPTK